MEEFKRKLLANSSLTVFPRIRDGVTQSETVDTRKTVFVLYKLVPFLAKPTPTREALLIVYIWEAKGGSVNRCDNLLNPLQVGMTLSGAATISAVVRGQIGDPVTPSAYLGRMMKTEVLEACLPVLNPNPDVFMGSSNPALENLLVKMGEIQVTAMEKE